MLIWGLLALLVVGLSVWAILVCVIWRDFNRSEKIIRDRMLRIEREVYADHKKRGGKVVD